MTKTNPDFCLNYILNSYINAGTNLIITVYTNAYIILV